MFNLLISAKTKDYKNYRWFFTSNNILVVGGKSDKQNELALKHFLKPEYTITHTSKPGSPFMIIQSKNPKPLWLSFHENQILSFLNLFYFKKKELNGSFLI